MNVRKRETDGDTPQRGDRGRIELLPRRDRCEMPEKPTMEMLTAGSLAGGVSVETAWNIWQAMRKAIPGKR